MICSVVEEIYDNLMAVREKQTTFRRPVFKCKFVNIEVKALYDTGSCITCISSEVYKSLSKADKVGELQPAERQFLSASGTRMKALGTVTLNMMVEGHPVQHELFVLPTLHEPMILGIDFIRRHNLGYCPKHHEFYWTEQCPKDHGVRLTLPKRMVLPPLSSRVCTLKLGSNREPGSTGIASIQIEEQPWIRGGPVLTKVTPSQMVTVELRNASPVPREMTRGLVIGLLETLDDDDVQQMRPMDEVMLKDLSEVMAMKNAPQRADDRSAKSSKTFIDTNAKFGCSEAEANKYRQVMYDNESVFSKHKNDLGRCDLVQHEIHLKDKVPVYIKQFKIPEVHSTSIEDQVKEWLKLDIVQPSMSRYNSPIFVVKKKDGNFRLVQDFRALNAKTYPDRYSMRDVNDCIHEIGKSGSRLFSTIDLTSGFWQMVLKPECREYTAFTVYGMGQFEFKTSPMGLLGCPASFQRLMEAAMKGIPNVLVYIDDILIHSNTHDEHRQILRQVFQRLKRFNLKIRLEKCHFAAETVEYLGFKLTPNGVLPGTDKTAVIRNAPPPDNVQKVRQFLGLCNFFRNHIRDFALRSHPLTILTRKDSPWKGGNLPPEALKAFQELKSALTSSPIVAFPRKDKQYALITDAATGDANQPGGMGAILTQVDRDGKFNVIAYASRKLVKHEINYTPFLLEMHAAVWGMEHFSHHLKGKRFLLFTDHKPLEKLGVVHTKTLHRIQEVMMEYDFEIHYKKGEEMPADFLSRNISSLTDDLSPDKIGLEQRKDDQLVKLIDYLEKGQLPNNVNDKKLIANYGARCFIKDGILWIRFARPEIGCRSLICLPSTLRQQAINHMHSSWFGGHAGILKTTERLLLYYYWPGLNTDVHEALKNCEKCQKTNTNPKIPTAMVQPLPLLTEPNQRVHADLFGPLKTSARGKKYILVMTDAFTRYVELVPIDNKETITVANAIFVFWICRYGVPLELVTDNGKEFVSKVCQELWKKLDLIHNTTTPRHPQANAQAEVVNRTIIRYLKSFVDQSTLDWEGFIAPLMFSYNTTFHRSIKTSPFFMSFGIHPRLPSELIRPAYGENEPTEIMQRLQVARNIAKEFMDKAAQEYKRQHDEKAVKRLFNVNQEVLLDEYSFLDKNQKLCEKFTGPHLITKIVGPVNVELLLNNGRKTLVHVNRIKPFRSDSTPTSQSQNGGGDGTIFGHNELYDQNLPIDKTDGSNDGKGGKRDKEEKVYEGRMTRSRTKLADYDSTKRSFSPSLEVQAIRRKRHKKNQVYPQVKSNYILFDDDEYDEWDPIPDWSGNAPPTNKEGYEEDYASDECGEEEGRNICDSGCDQRSLLGEEDYKEERVKEEFEVKIEIDPPPFDQWGDETKMEFDPLFENKTAWKIEHSPPSTKKFQRVMHSPPIKPSAPFKGVSFDETVVRHQYNPTPTLQTKKQQRLVDQAQTIIKQIQDEQSKPTGSGGSFRGDRSSTNPYSDTQTAHEAEIRRRSSSAGGGSTDRERRLGLRHGVSGHYPSYGDQRSDEEQSAQRLVPPRGSAVRKFHDASHFSERLGATGRVDTAFASTGSSGTDGGRERIPQHLGESHSSGGDRRQYSGSQHPGLPVLPSEPKLSTSTTETPASATDQPATDQPANTGAIPRSSGRTRRPPGDQHPRSPSTTGEETGRETRAQRKAWEEERSTKANMGLSTWTAVPGHYDSLQVRTLAERWVSDQQWLEINQSRGRPPARGALEEQQRRREQIIKLSKETGAVLPPDFLG